ncbi:MAG: D-alanyl-D-alanine carboxypeptidase/D-alanyl-D-alanine-endopeptidase [Candidatus Phosphoribacter sp.]|nr:D-alanyl-D-alanine carboxypeptidase/D-alanyl-D-alanine-endopeptidase [Actinomycetales bacterium]
MRRAAALCLGCLLLASGYVAADALDVAPGILTTAPARTASPSATTRASASRPLPSPLPSRMPVAPLDAQAQVPTQAGLRAALGSVLADPGLAGMAVTIRDGLTGAHLLDVDPDTARIPASTLKLLAALAVTASFPPGSTLETTVVAGESRGQLVLVAGGDMFLATQGGDPTAVVGRAGVAELADQVSASVAAMGVTAVTVSIDTTYAPGAAEAPSWPARFRATGIVGPVAMLGLAERRAEPGKPGSREPVIDVARTLIARLSERGVTATLDRTAPQEPSAVPSGTPGTPGASATHDPAASPNPGWSRGAVLGVVRSAPVADLLGLALRDSDNALTESLARQGAFRAGRPSDFAGAAAYVREAVAAAGVDVSGVSLFDASGLTAANQIPARVVADVLEVGVSGRRPAFGDALRQLPIAGLSGTLAERFTSASEAPGAGLVRAKTGTLSGANALAGIVVTREGRLLVFALLQQGATGTLDTRAALDRVAVTLASCGCRA